MEARRRCGGVASLRRTPAGPPLSGCSCGFLLAASCLAKSLRRLIVKRPPGNGALPPLGLRRLVLPALER